MSGVHLTLAEWGTLTPDTTEELRGLALSNDEERVLAKTLDRAGLINVFELRQGLRVQSYAYVGRIALGRIEITVNPKIEVKMLSALLRFAYGFRCLRTYGEALYASKQWAFQDLLIQQLAVEIDELVSRGLTRQYVRTSRDLSSPRGRLNLAQIARSGGVHAPALPCECYPRLEDCVMNQVLLAGASLATSLTTQPQSRALLKRLSKLLAESVSTVPLSADLLSRASQQDNRLWAAYRPARRLIELLLASTGLTLDDQSRHTRLPGFLFDMNRFFQRLIGAVLHESLPDCHVASELFLHGMMAYAQDCNLPGRKAPTPRPDFVVIRGTTPRSVLDAKYRDIWRLGLPREMLYQLAMYALWQGPSRKATIIYPTEQAGARDAVVEINDPLNANPKARVVLRPVQLADIHRLFCDPRPEGARADRDREDFGRRLAFG